MAERDDTHPDGEPPLYAGEPAAAEAGPLPRHRRPVFMTAVVMAVAVAGGALWYGLSGSDRGADGDVPLVRADREPIKVQPTDPGGMDVPDQDKLVYDRMGGETDRPQVERLLPPPETPLDPPAPPPAPVEEASVEPLAPPPAAELAPDAPPPPPPPMVPAPITQPAPPPPVVAATPVPAPPTPVPAPVAPPRTTAAAGAGGYKVQLGSVRSMEAAESEWSRLSKRHADVLGNLALDVERADLGQRGVFFRVQAGPLATEEAAKRVCDSLKSKDVGCLVVAP